ncbi:MAG: MarR family transcriptional regulator [Rhodanobacter lindaniclasticus]
MSQLAQRSLCESIEAMESAFRSAASRVDGLSVDDVVLLRSLQMVAPALEEAFGREVRKHAGIGKTEFRTLMLLLGKDGCAAPSELCNFDHLGRANMTRVADVLVKRGLVTRKAGVDDRRRVSLCITSKGRKLVARLVPGVAKGEAAVFEGISLDQRRQVADALRRIAANLDAWNRSRP